MTDNRPMQGEPGAGGRGNAGIDAVIHELARLRRRAKAMLIAQRAATILAGAIAIGVLAAAIDFVIRTPDLLRIVLLLIGAGVAGFFVWKLVVPALRFRPPLSEIALRIERTEAGAKSGLRGVLASGIELARARECGREEDLENRLAEPVLVGAEAAIRSLAAANQVDLAGIEIADPAEGDRKFNLYVERGA